MEGNAVVLPLTAELVGWEGSRVSQVEYLPSVGHGKITLMVSPTADSSN